MKLTELNAKPITKETPPLSRGEVEERMREIPQWTLGIRAIEREFRFKDFRQAMEFVNRVAAVANEQDHHPDIFISYNKVQVTLTTHKVSGLTMNDLIVAARIDQLIAGEERERAA